MTDLRRIPVRIEGDWQPVAYVGHVDWRGTVIADEPLTGLALIESANGTQWARIGRGGTPDLNIRLSVRPGSGEGRSDAMVWLSIQPSGRGDGSGMAQVATPAHLTSTAPFMLSLNHHATGESAWIADVRASEKLRIGALFVAETDTRSARNHLWHLREGISGPGDPMTQALTRGRSGLFEER